MKFNRTTAALVVLSVTGAWAQSAPNGLGPARRAPVSHMSSHAGQAGRNVPAALTPATPRQRVEEMEVTLDKMRALLQKMQAKSASNSRDPIARANLEMWGLMVDHVDSELKELRIAMLIREDLDKRRDAMYKQADLKAQSEARAAKMENAPAAPLSAGQSQPGPDSLHTAPGASPSHR